MADNIVPTSELPSHPHHHLVDILRKEGLQVQEEGGRQQRGHGDMADIRGVMMHHAAGASEGNYPSPAIVRDGDATP